MPELMCLLSPGHFELSGYGRSSLCILYAIGEQYIEYCEYHLIKMRVRGLFPSLGQNNSSTNKDIVLKLEHKRFFFLFLFSFILL